MHRLRCILNVRCHGGDMSNLREELRQGLIASYKHRQASGAQCALCGDHSRPLAFHILEASFPEGSSTPAGFVPMSASMGRLRGSYPICSKCAPACKKCGLPIPTEKALELGHKLKAATGNGICQDMQFGLFVQAIFKRIFGIGRFAKTAK